jgi:hypothetical protein
MDGNSEGVLVSSIWHLPESDFPTFVFSPCWARNSLLGPIPCWARLWRESRRAINNQGTAIIRHTG